MSSYPRVPPWMCKCVFVNMRACYSKKRDSFEGWVLSLRRYITLRGLSVEYRFVYLRGQWEKEWRGEHSRGDVFRVRHPQCPLECSCWWRPDSHWQTRQSLSKLQTLRDNPLWQALSIHHNPDAFPSQTTSFALPYLGKWITVSTPGFWGAKLPDGAHGESRYVILGCEPLGSYWENFFLPLKMMYWSPVLHGWPGARGRLNYQFYSWWSSL